MAKIFIDEVHAQNVLQRLWEQTERKQYCDITLIPGDTEEMQISAHRSVLCASSEYFEKMFTPPFKESTAEKIKLPNVDGETLKDLVRFCYSGRLEMSEDKAEKLLTTANLLLLDGVVNACGNFLAELLHPNNCLGMVQLAERHRCESLSKKSLQFCFEHFRKLYKTEEFLNLSAEQLSQLLANDQLHDPTEEHVFKGLMIWLEHDPSKRQQHKDEMLKLVRMPLMKTSFLIEHVKPVCNSIASLKLYTDARDWRHMPKRKRLNPRELRKADEYLMAIKKENKKLAILYYCSKRLKWMKWLKNLEPRKEFEIAVMGNDLFIVGGEIEDTIVNTVVCLNLKNMTTKMVNPMNQPRAVFGVAVTNGYLYAVGGNGDVNGDVLHSVEQWHSRSNTWEMVSDMSGTRHCFGCTVYDEEIYAVGGIDVFGDINDTECYNPQEDEWTSIASIGDEDRTSPGLTVANGLLYLVGGERRKTIERYDLETNKWTMMCSFSEEVLGRLCTTFNDKVIALYDDRVEEYNSTTNECTVNTDIKGLENAYYIFSFSGSLLESEFIENK